MTIDGDRNFLEKDFQIQTQSQRNKEDTDRQKGTGSSPFQYEMESAQLKAEIDLKSIYGLKLATPFKIHLIEQ